MSDQSFRETILNAIEEKGFALSKLAELSRVPERYLELLLREEYDHLPSAPYLHGYLLRLARVLNLDSELLWEIFKKEYRLKTSGLEDRLPVNRFAIDTLSNTKILITGGLIVLTLLYLAFRWNTLFGKPSLVILDPAENIISTTDRLYTIRGSTDRNVKITINNDLIETDDRGSFSKDVFLETGDNSFTITAKKLLGREISVVRQITVPLIDESESVLSPLSPSPTSETSTTTPQ